VLAVLGDLVDDIVVTLAGPVELASDTEARIRRRRGGSAANVAAVAAGRGAAVRFLGQVGDDRLGRLLVDELGATGVDVGSVRFAGATGSIVVLVDDRGERHMLTDRGAAVLLGSPNPAWLDDVTALHVPLYSFAAEPLATTSRALVGWCHGRDVAVSIDLSSVALLEALGPDTLAALLAASRPAMVFANADEAALAGPLDGLAATVVVKRGAAGAVVHRPGEPPVAVPCRAVYEGRDTTGAGDAFAAGFLATAGWRADPLAAAAAGHAAAAALIAAR